MNTSLDSSHKTFIDNLCEARDFRKHKKRLDEVYFTGMSILDPHPIVSKRDVRERQMTQKILYENALIINKLKEANDGK